MGKKSRKNVGGEPTKMEKFQRRAQEISARFRLGSHYTIERFAVIAGVLAVSGALVLSLTVWGALRAGNAVLGSTSLFTTEFAASRTGATGTVEPVYVSADKTRALVLMKFEQPSQMSSNAEDYYVYVTGIDGGPGGGPTKVATPMNGAIYAFADTGYIGVLLEAPEGFPSQLLNLTVRAKKELLTPKNNPGTPGMDRSFIDNDQWRVIINPGASSATHLTALDSERLPNPEDVFAYAVTWREEQAKRKVLDQRLADMKTQLTRIENFSTKMDQTTVRMGPDTVRLLPPSLPAEIDGDSITGMDSTELRRALKEKPAEEIEGIGTKTQRARMLDTFSDGYMVNTFELHSDKTIGGGTDFNWRQRSVADGYFETLGTGLSSISEYLEKLSKQSRPSMSSRDLVWPLSNGKTINDLRPGDTAAKPLIELRNNLMAAYDEYFQLKREYQTVDLLDLLVMEQTLDSVKVGATKESGPEAVGVKS